MGMSTRDDVRSVIHDKPRGVTEPHALFDVLMERRRQDATWGEQNHVPLEWLSVLGEEVGEACQAANKAYWGDESQQRYREEMVHVAAVALAAIECMDRGVCERPLMNRENDDAD